jgi:hypothetical protein
LIIHYSLHEIVRMQCEIWVFVIQNKPHNVTIKGNGYKFTINLCPGALSWRKICMILQLRQAVHMK